MMIERIRINELEDMIENLVNSSILSRMKVTNKVKKCIRLEVELDELTEALSEINKN